MSRPESAPALESPALESQACFEFVRHGAFFPPELPALAGETQRDAEGQLTLLHFAPSRWLIPAPSATLRARLVELQAQGQGSLFDVDGKWQRFRTTNPTGLMGGSINLGAILRARGCAAIVVFDCPAIVACGENTVDLWVASSYVEAFLSAAKRALGLGMSDVLAWQE